MSMYSQENTTVIGSNTAELEQLGHTEAREWMPQFRSYLRMLLVCLFLASPLVGTAPSQAQFDFFAVPEDDPVTVTASFKPIADSQQAILEVQATMGAGYHIYSMTQKQGLPSSVTLQSKEVKRVGPFVADREPEIHPPNVDIDYETETYEGTVSWQALIEFPAGTNVADQKVALHYRGLACDATACNPYDADVTAKAKGKATEIPAKLLPEDLPAEDGQVSGPAASPSVLPEGAEQITAGSATLTGWLDARAIQPGKPFKLTIKAEMQDGYHTYPYLPASETVAAYGPSYMGVVGVSGSNKELKEFQFGAASADREPHVSVLGDLEIPEFSDTVHWTMEITVPENPGSDELVFHGVMQSQTCNESSCDVPAQLQWHVAVKVAAEPMEGRSKLTWSKLVTPAQELLTDTEKAQIFLAGLQSPSVTDVLEQQTEANGDFAGGAPFDISRLTPKPFQDSQSISLPVILGIALLGGFILNFMPCVLPVIGLKILSLVEQAGESRSRAFTFNIVYVSGMLCVFWILAFMSSFMNMGWGGQFSSGLFNITFAAVVFAMALSYLEIWEITLPSFVGMQSSKLEQRDGLMGTFFKGMVTTILATPCSGPGLATALAWCADKPASMTFLIFTFLGLGMGIPYILVAFFPSMISFLPKPGPWMNTFKQLMGFVLLGTVAFFMSYINMEYLFPTFCFLMVIWFACWLVGRLNFSSTANQWFSTWAGALGILVLSSYFIFGWQVSPQLDKQLGGGFNNRFASSWNLIAAQKYRLNSFVDSQNEKRGGAPMIIGSGNTMLASAKSERSANQQHGGIKWVPYSLQALEHYTNGEKPRTVFIDFTADWCVNCKIFERTVLHAEEISKRLGSEEVVMMIADKTQFNEEIDELLKGLGGGIQIPLYAVFPKSDPYSPIILDGTSISFENVNEVLDRVGVPSVDQVHSPEAGSQEALEMLEDEGMPVPTNVIGSLRQIGDARF